MNPATTGYGTNRAMLPSRRAPNVICSTPERPMHVAHRNSTSPSSKWFSKCSAGSFTKRCTIVANTSTVDARGTSLGSSGLPSSTAVMKPNTAAASAARTPMSAATW